MQANSAKREAAVIVPVYRTRQGELRMLLVRRGPGGVHGGQIAFPGGMQEDADQTLLDTALRELQEEMGITAAEIKVLAALPTLQTMTTGVTVSPFLAEFLQPGQWRLSEQEIAEVFELPVEHFARPESHDYGMESFSGWPEPRRVPFYRVGAYRAWGLTYRILEPLVPRLLAREWTV